jgi:hypothetical protein
MRRKHSFVVILAPTLGLYDDSGFGPSVTALERNRLSETGQWVPDSPHANFRSQDSVQIAQMTWKTDRVLQATNRAAN